MFVSVLDAGPMQHNDSVAEQRREKNAKLYVYVVYGIFWDRQYKRKKAPKSLG